MNSLGSHLRNLVEGVMKLAKKAWDQKQIPIAAIALLSISVNLVLGFSLGWSNAWTILPLWIALTLGGVPLVAELTIKLFRREFGSDLLAGISIVTAVLLGEYLAGTLVVLMLSGGESIEAFAVRRASSVLKALANRMPSIAHRKSASAVADVDLDEVEIGDQLIVFPHEIAPVDGTVVEGHSVMDESYLTGEPYMMSKTPGSEVFSGAINGDQALTIRADKLPVDSRYAKIMQVMRESEQQRPKIRRLGDQLGAIYTPLALAIAIAAGLISGDPIRFLAVLVVATPCPLLIGIPVSIIGSISLAARRGIIIRDPSVLESVDQCETVIFDKTGTLTYGRPELTEQIITPGFDSDEVLQLVGSLEKYSKHPLSFAIIDATRKSNLNLIDAAEVNEKPGQGLIGNVDGRQVQITSRGQVIESKPEEASLIPPLGDGLECVIRIDDRYAATYRFRDEPRLEGQDFVHHLGPKHRLSRIMLVSGDRESEVKYLAERVGIHEIEAEKSPEEKLAIVTAETEKAATIFVGDGINDAPALMAATVGVAFGQNSDITTEAAGAVVMDSTLERVDEFFHIGKRMRRIALQSAVGGMALSVIGMGLAAFGYLPPVAGAVAQEVIDVVAVLNALRAAFPPSSLTDY